MLNAQQILTFTRTYGGTNYDDARSMASTTDAGSIVYTGLSKSMGDTMGDMYLTKVNAAGAVYWKRSYSRAKEDGGNSVILTSDGGYLITGHTALSSNEECDGYIVKTDAEGIKQWHLLVGTDYDDVCNDAIELEDGSFLITGRVEDESTHTFNVLLARLSAQGELLWLKALSLTLPSIGFKIKRSADGDVLIAGHSNLPGQSGTQMLILKCSTDGTVRWHHNLETNLSNRAFGVVATPDGGCIVAGGANEMNEQSNMAVFQLDASGTIIASNTQLALPGSGALYDIIRTSSGKIAVAGSLQRPNSDFYRPIMGVLDDNLSVDTWNTADFNTDCRTKGLWEDAAGNFFLCGNTLPTADYKDADIFLAKMPSIDAVSSTVDLDAIPFLLFPNPMHTTTYLKIGKITGTKTLTMYNIEGKIVRQTTFESEEIFIARGTLTAGNYTLLVADATGRKMVSTQLVIR